MQIKSLSNQQIYVLIELWDQEKDQGNVVNISPSEIIIGYYQYSKIKQSHRVIISRGLKGLVNRGWLRKEGHRYSLTDEGRRVARQIIGLDQGEEKKKEKAPQHDLKKLREIYLKAKLALKQEAKKIEDKKENQKAEEIEETEEEEYPKWKTII
jgi:hypothetical protein